MGKIEEILIKMVICKREDKYPAVTNMTDNEIRDMVEGCSRSSQTIDHLTQKELTETIKNIYERFKK